MCHFLNLILVCVYCLSLFCGLRITVIELLGESSQTDFTSLQLLLEMQFSKLNSHDMGCLAQSLVLLICRTVFQYYYEV